MMERFNNTLDRISEFLAHRKGLLPLLGLFLVVINFFIQFFPTVGWISESNFLLHIGVMVAILGFLIAWAL